MPGGHNDDLPVLAKAYGFGDVRSVSYLADGLMNRNWRVETAGGDFAVKQIIDIPVPLARRNLAVVAALAAAGVPACPAATTREGDVVFEIADRSYALFPWVRGTHPLGTDLDLPRVHELGTLLGRLHDGLNTTGKALLPEMPDQIRTSVADVQVALAEADRFRALAAADSSPFAAEVTGFLERRTVLLEKLTDHCPSDEVPEGPFGWTHGDFQHLNVLWDQGVVQGVVDWDRIRVRPFGEEVARSATLLFGREKGDLDLDRVTAFVQGYRSVVDLPVEALADAVHRLWWKRMADYWHLEFHYDRSDHSCDHLFVSASLFLDWWTGHLAEVQDAFAA
jgi:Ser/Thr protein kinase RdoA (MazF antagonist)